MIKKCDSRRFTLAGVFDFRARATEAYSGASTVVNILFGFARRA